VLILAAVISIRGDAKQGSVDWIFVLDTSASMHGAGGAANIFEKVKDAISDFIRNAREGDTVTLYTFDRDTTLRGHIRVSGEIDKKDLLKIVQDLPSEGDRTYTGKAIHDALERAIEFKQRSDAGDRTTSIVLFTDGLEDVRGIADPISIPSNIALLSKAQPYVFFVSVGVQAHEPQLENFVEDPAMGGRGEVIRDPGASGIAEVAERIRKIVEAPVAPTPIKLTVDPATLSLGKIEPGETSSPVVQVNSNVACQLRIGLNTPENGSLILSEPRDAVLLKPGENHSLQVRLAAADHLSDGLRAFTLVLTAEPIDSTSLSTTVNVEGNVNLVRTPLWRKAVRYLLLLLILSVIILAIVSVVRGDPPWIWLPAISERATLQGELQVVHPRPARVEDEFISLTQLHAKKVYLSSLIPNVVDGSDAELEAIKLNGELSVNLQRIKGNIYVNKVEVAHTRIYNDDVIELGGSKLLFSWVNHDRPSDAGEATEM